MEYFNQIQEAIKQGEQCQKNGQIDQAIAHFQSAVDIKPTPIAVGLPLFKIISKERAKAYQALGRLYERKRIVSQAIAAYWEAALCDPSYWIDFARSIRAVHFLESTPSLVDAIHLCLQNEKINPQHLAVPGISLVKLNPHYHSKGFNGVMDNPLLLSLLRNTIIPDPDLEAFLTHQYKKHTNDEFDKAVVEQRNATEYVYQMGDLESALPPKDTLLVNNLISQQVKEQYERSPYPRWRRIDQPLPVTFESYLKNTFPHLTMKYAFPKKPLILIAGCGTGAQAIATAALIKESHVIALDLSSASLKYAKEKSDELNIRNIEFLQGDILEMSKDISFDIIECVGVLHHMENPLEGWSILRSLLKPDGWMCIGLYSKLGRRDVMAAKKFLEENHLTSIQEARRALMKMPVESLIHRVTQSLDFYSNSGCRDLLFNVHEIYFTIPQIAAILNTLHLEFIGFYLSDPGIAADYVEQFPEDFEMKSLENWDQFEQRNPDTFLNMYQFWVRHC